MQGKISDLPLQYVYPTLASAKSPLCLVSPNPSGVEWGWNAWVLHFVLSQRILNKTGVRKYLLYYDFTHWNYSW